MFVTKSRLHAGVKGIELIRSQLVVSQSFLLVFPHVQLLTVQFHNLIHLVESIPQATVSADLGLFSVASSCCN